MNQDKKEEGLINRKAKLSVIIPITERHDNVKEIYYDFLEALSDRIVKPEFIFVVDGKFEEAYQDLKSLRQSGKDLTIIRHSRSFGESTSISGAFKHATGDLILTLPSYYQAEAAEVMKLFESIDGYDLVIGRRWPRNDSQFNQFQTKLFHVLAKSITGVNMNDIGCSIRLMKRSVLEEIDLYGDLHRFLPMLADKQGFKINEVEIRQSYREKRLRTYPFGVYLTRLIDLLTVFFLVKFTKKPLRFFGLAGTAILLPGLLLTFYLVAGRILGKFGLSDRPLFLLGILLIVLGIQIFAIGLVGEIITFTHSKELKDYRVEETIN